MSSNSTNSNSNNNGTTKKAPSGGSSSTTAAALPDKKTPVPTKTVTAAVTTVAAAAATAKQNAWSKPLQQAAKPGTGTDTGGAAPATGASTKSSSNNKAYNSKRTPPGLSAAPTSSANATTAPTTAVSKEVTTALRERFLHLLLTLVGHKVTVDLRKKQGNGEVTVTGMFHTATPFSNQTAAVRNKYVLKAVQSSDETLYATGSTVVLDMADVTKLHVGSIRLETAAAAVSADLRTDVEISAAAADKNASKQLVQASAAWTAPASRADVMLESGSGARNAGTGKQQTAPLKGSIEGWDQFKANEKLFNVRGGYDENLYTTALDKTQMNSKKIKEAERIAREIETSVSTNMHIAEERGQAVEGDYDEEDRYSGVLKKKADGPKKVMNYAAAAAAKADIAAAPPGFKGGTKRPVKTEVVAETTKVEEASTEKEENAKEPTKAVPETPAAETNTEGEQKDAPKSKLSATAKSFSLSIKAKEWTPTFGAPAAPVEPPVMVDPATGMPVVPIPPQYMPQPGMGQPGMAPVMNQQYPGVRYSYGPGMEQQMLPQMTPQQQPQAPPPPPQSVSAATSGAASPATGLEDDTSVPQQQPAGDAESASQQSTGAPPTHQQQQYAMQQQQQQQMQMPYGMPPPQQQGNYYGGQMSMHPGQQRGPAGPHPGYGHPGQFMHQQMPGPGMYPRQMYPGMPPGNMPNMMRGPNGMPYYSGPAGGQMGYPPYGGGGGYEDDGGSGGGYRGGRGGRGGRGRSARGGGSGRYNNRGGGGSNNTNGGRGGRGGYNNNYNNNYQPPGGGNGGGPHQQQQQPPPPPEALTPQAAGAPATENGDARTHAQSKPIAPTTTTAAAPATETKPEAAASS